MDVQTCYGGTVQAHGNWESEANVPGYPDNAWAYYTGGVNSGALDVNAFGATVPDGVTPLGMEIHGRMYADTDDQSLLWIYISKDGGANWTAARGPYFVTSAINWIGAGSNSDLWGLTFTPAEWRSANLWIRFIVTQGAGNIVRIDSLRINFYYSTGTSTPSVSTSAASNVTQNSATANGNVTDDGGGITERGFCWNTTGTPESDENPVHDHTNAEGIYSMALTGLPIGTMIYVRAYAVNGAGTAYGNEITFSTNPFIPGMMMF